METYFVMALIMSVCPLAMSDQKFSYSDITIALQVHMIGFIVSFTRD